MSASCVGRAWVRVPAWPCPAGTLDYRRPCKRAARKGSRYCWTHDPARKRDGDRG